MEILSLDQVHTTGLIRALIVTMICIVNINITMSLFIMIDIIMMSHIIMKDTMDSPIMNIMISLTTTSIMKIHTMGMSHMGTMIEDITAIILLITNRQGLSIHTSNLMLLMDTLITRWFGMVQLRHGQ